MIEELGKLKDLYARMDMQFGQLSAACGLACGDCDENCCTERFHHYTVAEYLYLLEGLKAAETDLRENIIRRSRVVVESYAHELQAGEIFRLMCPANFDGLCALYEWRPMICRLHGLPHHFIMPDGARKTGTGCHRVKGGSTVSLDRTPFYTELALIEKNIREKTGYRERFRKTTAQMIMDMSLELDIEEV
ncbi:MAG: hypothetical protein M0Z58_01530 [Nitrospiraceae bacterium]|nr:hypothetical protein [Nitrospiraceae bacterium]